MPRDRLAARAKREWRKLVVNVERRNRHSCDAQRVGVTERSGVNRCWVSLGITGRMPVPR